MKKYKCCICGRIEIGYGNNPYPIVDDEDSRCCDICDLMYVVPARIKDVYSRKGGKRENDSK